MIEPAPASLKPSPLRERHLALGGRMIAFAGWELPLEYAGTLAEHEAVRTRAGLFDVSHMGEIEVAGGDALALVQLVTSNDASRLAVGQAQYTAITTPAGTFVDDALVYRLAADHFLFVVNAATTAKDYGWVREQARTFGDAVVVDTSARYALLALQGPLAAQILQPLTGVDLSGLRYYWFAAGEVAGVRATISRTGYTGEDGFEIFVPPAAAPRVWDALLEAGRSAGLRPCGLGARDTLRLEAGMRLYGQDIDETTTVLEAGLGWIIAWHKPTFIGAEALRRQREDGVTRRLAGFELLERGIARPGAAVFAGEARVGTVTSGGWAPSLGKAIGLAYLPVALAREGSEIAVDVRGRRLRASVVPLPFYRRAR
ncbi:MAG TPA: glycine cleavage system aminomethyltransferase GcvT [Vicinamibacterales bacterium]|nr:glycine cleavage system aminomethyltransferase GcvT [Vicinamibacterales bacterium]